MSTEANKQLVRRLVDEALARHDPVVIDEIATGPPAAPGRRFEGVDEVYIFGVHDGKLATAIGVEDNLTRLRQLGIAIGGSTSSASA